MLQVHWMLYVLFTTLVITILIVLLGTFGYAHAADRKQQAAGWWAGVTLAILILADSSEAFSALPTYDGELDVASIVAETVQVSWLFAIAMAVIAIGAMIVVEHFTIPEKGIALILLFASCFSLYALAHLILIRTLNGALFTSFTGCCFGFLLYQAFLKGGATSTADVKVATPRA